MTEPPEIQYLSTSDYNPNNLDQLDFPDLDYSLITKKISDCSEMGLNEIENKDICVAASTDILNILVRQKALITNPDYEDYDYGWRLWNGGDTSSPNLPKGCSIATTTGKVIGLGAVPGHNMLHFQTDDGGSDYADSTRLDMKVCKQRTTTTPTSKKNEGIPNNWYYIGAGVMLIVLILLIIKR